MANKKITDKDFAKMEKIPNDRNKYIKKGLNFYLSYTLRIIIMFGFVIVLGFLIYFCFDNGFSNGKTITLNYEEKDEVKSVFKLLESDNSLTGSEVLAPGNYFSSDDIDDISTDLNYQYKLSGTANVKYSYYVDFETKVIDETSNIKLYDNKYRYMEETVKEEQDVKEINISQNINIDYDDLNNDAKMVKDINSEVDSNISGFILLKLYVNIETTVNGFDEPLKKDVVVEAKIPLLSNQVSVEKVSNNIIKDSYVKHFAPEIANSLLLYLGVILLILDTTLLLLAINFVVRTLPKKSEYCQRRDDILSRYNHLIVNSKKMPDITGYNVIECESFSELLDAQHLVDKPIVYYEIVKKQKCIFVILGVTDAYRYILKEADID